MAHPVPNLNWQEIENFASRLRPVILGFFVDRIVVPERPRFPHGYLKGEWAIRLTSRKEECTLLVSVRPRAAYFGLISGKGPKASALATRSPFDLNLSKVLKDRRILDVEAVPRERTVILWLSGEGREDQLGLVLNLVPSAPEALLVKAELPVKAPGRWPILSRTRTLKPGDRGFSAEFSPADGSRAPENPGIRPEFAGGADFIAIVERALEDEAFGLRLQALTKALRELMKYARDRLRQSETGAAEAENEPDWKRYADLLKGRLAESPPLILTPKPHRIVRDYETADEIEIPSDPQLGLSEQVEKFYQLARRKGRRLEEARSRIRTFHEKISEIETNISALPAAGDWRTLERLERQAGITVAASAGARTERKPAVKKTGTWLGKTFVSRDGLTFWVGRNKNENLELTFKHARGNDLWLHVRGRPGAHAVIPLQPGKSAPLETLLDAATMTVYYSGGESWGKTEVDYTYKKNVKRIKDSSEASYIQNKTLIIEPDPARIQRLLESGRAETATK